MKREVVVLVSLSILLLASCSLPASQRLAIEPAGMVFAEIIAGECASNSIQTCNTSCSIVSVSRVVPCCGAEATLTPMRIEPGTTARLTVTLKPQLPGEIKKDVRIFCDDPEGATGSDMVTTVNYHRYAKRSSAELIAEGAVS